MAKKDKYADLDSDTFDRILREVINDSNSSACDVLQIPGVYEILSEHYNNEVLERWESDHTCAECGLVKFDLDDQQTCKACRTPEFSNYQE